jgi:hypothetical protein
LGPRLGIERCGKINGVNSAAERGTGIGVVAGFAGAAGMMHWPHLKMAKIIVAIPYLQIL